MTRKTRTSSDPRLNLALTEENFEYVKTMAGVKGQTATQYINELIEANRQQNEELYRQVKELQERLK